MAKLSEAVKAFVVQHLAMYDTPSQVAAAVKEELGVEVSRQQVEAYNPERSGEKPAKKWCDLFEATRKAFLDEVATVPQAHKSVRVRMLGRAAAAAERKGNFVLMRDLLETIAKEVGDAYTNKRKLVGGKPEDGDQPIAAEYTFVPFVPPPVGVQASSEDDD